MSPCFCRRNGRTSRGTKRGDGVIELDCVPSANNLNPGIEYLLSLSCNPQVFLRAYHEQTVRIQLADDGEQRRVHRSASRRQEEDDRRNIYDRADQARFHGQMDDARDQHTGSLHTPKSSASEVVEHGTGDDDIAGRAASGPYLQPNMLGPQWKKRGMMCSTYDSSGIRSGLRD